MDERLRDAASAFDGPALVAALRERYPGLPIRFASYDSRSTQASFVRSIDVGEDHVLVTLNIGLAAATSPLPSYFLSLLEHATVGPALAGVLGVADDRLLRDRVDALDPTASPRLLRRPRALREDALAMARPASPATAHWLFQAVYPELSVSVLRAPVRRGLPMEELRLGLARLGDAAFGDSAEVMVAGLEVALCTEESDTWNGLPWLEEARARLRQRVFPALRRAAAHLRVLLVDHESRGRLTLRRPSQLGLDPLAEARPPRVSLLFEGRVPEARKVVPVREDV